MFRLIRLAAYGLLAYVVYEMYQGMSEENTSRRHRTSAAGGLSEALNRGDSGRMGVITGPARGTTVSSQDAGGTSAPHAVGRGVTST